MVRTPSYRTTRVIGIVGKFFLFLAAYICLVITFAVRTFMLMQRKPSAYRAASLLNFMLFVIANAALFIYLYYHW